MGIKPDALKDICNLANKQVQGLYPNLKMVFIPHESGQFHDIATHGQNDLAKHPAGKVAQTILEKSAPREQSSFLGIAIHHEERWRGLVTQDHILALFNINVDEINTPADATRTIYHLIWHAIDLVEVRLRPEYEMKFKSGPMIPKRSPMNLAHLNLQADVFSSVMIGLQGEKDALETLAYQRALDSITPIHTRRAEDYPFVIAVEAAQYAYDELLSIKPSSDKYMRYTRQLATEVGETFDDKSIRQWWAFSEPAQDMAWRHFDPDFILGCAVYSSEDPFVRATGHLVSDLTNIAPTQESKASDSYNAYANQEKNQLLHRELVEKAFEEAIARGVREESGYPFVAAANEQNESLADGIILGWCASALQSAARAFEGALSNGISPMQAARLEFESTKEETNWDVLKKIGNKIIDQKRKGFDVTLGNVAEIAGESPAFEPVLRSIRATMKNPDFVQKLELANDLGVRGPAPLPVFAPSAAPKVQGPSQDYAPAPPAPGLGGNNNTSYLRAMAERIRKNKGEGEKK